MKSNFGAIFLRLYAKSKIPPWGFRISSEGIDRIKVFEVAKFACTACLNAF